MSRLYLYSIVPVISVSLLLFFSALLHGRRARGLAAYCLAVALWSGSLLLAFLPASADLGQRLVATGGFVVAAYLHAACDLIDAGAPASRRSRWLIWVAYAAAAMIALVPLVSPGLLYDPIALRAGPIFWPSMAGAAAAATLPLWLLIRAYRRAQTGGRGQLFGLAAAGGLGYLGAASNAILLSHGHVLPVGLFVVLASLFVLADVVRRQQPPSEQRLLQRSLAYAAIASFISAGFLLGVLSLMGKEVESLLEYRVSAFFLLGLALLAFQPLRQHLQELLGRRLLRSRAGAAELAAALAEEEQRADQASRLAELGAFTSAVAHEVRGPLGVLAAQLHGLRREGVAPERLAEMQHEVRRAAAFVEDLLRYGRPRPLQLRKVDLDSLVELAFSTARQGAARDDVLTEMVLEQDGLDGLSLEADPSQLLQVFVILFENALHALKGRPEPTVCVRAGGTRDRITIAVEDNGPGIDPQVLPRVFEPFVTGRKGVGLGLAIARGIVERHKGTINAGRAEPRGARFELQLPRAQPVLAAATGVT